MIFLKNPISQAINMTSRAVGDVIRLIRRIPRPSDADEVEAVHAAIVTTLATIHDVIPAHRAIALTLPIPLRRVIRGEDHQNQRPIKHRLQLRPMSTSDKRRARSKIKQRPQRQRPLTLCQLKLSQLRRSKSQRLQWLTLSPIN